jgi:hypothetical protein
MINVKQNCEEPLDNLKNKLLGYYDKYHISVVRLACITIAPNVVKYTYEVPASI